MITLFKETNCMNLRFLGQEYTTAEQQNKISYPLC